MLALVIGGISDEHRPLRPMLQPKGSRDSATGSMDLRGFALSECFVVVRRGMDTRGARP